jgi:hypothetical protein
MHDYGALRWIEQATENAMPAPALIELPRDVVDGETIHGDFAIE